MRKPVSTNAISEIPVGGVGELGECSTGLAVFLAALFFKEFVNAVHRGTACAHTSALRQLYVYVSNKQVCAAEMAVRYAALCACRKVHT